MGTLCIVGGMIGYALTQSIIFIAAGIGYVWPYYLGLFDDQCSAHPRPPSASCVVSVPRTCPAVMASTRTWLTSFRLHLVSRITLLALKPCKVPTPNGLSQVRRAFVRAIIPILTPEICKASDPRNVYYHVSRDGRILRHACI
jgi:hypothetical protein